MIDWEGLARSLATVHDDASGRREHGSDTLARRLLERVVPEDDWVAAVDHYVARRPGSELARSVLWLVHPWAAMERCDAIARTSDVPEDRRSAIELLRVVADRRGLPLIARFLADDDALVRVWAAKAVEQLLYSGLVEVDECGELLDAMQRHGDPAVRKVLDEIRSPLADADEGKGSA